MTSLLPVFGYPPKNLDERTTNVMIKSFPVVSFIPSIPHFQKGLDLFTIKPAWGRYISLLAENQFTTPNNQNNGIKVAFLADNFPTDSFTNEYGENFLQKFTDVASEGAASVAQMMGASSASQAYNAFTNTLKESQNAAGKAAGKGLDFIGQLMGSFHDAVSKVPAIGATTSSGVSVLNRLLAGSRIDFPMVWKSSGFQPSYSLTVRLYNPFPQNNESTEKYIIGPIVALMLLAVPRAQDTATFTWPFLHRISCPGIFELDPGFISNITIIKGGDQQQISFNQRLSIVDVRIDVGSLYSTMMGASRNVNATRPTVAKYAQNMRGYKKITSRQYDNEINTPGSGNFPNVKSTVITSRNSTVNVSGNTTGSRGNGYTIPTGETAAVIEKNYVNSRRQEQNQLREVSPKASQTVEDTSNDPQDRVTDQQLSTYNTLLAEGD